LPDRYAFCRLAAGSRAPAWADGSTFCSVTRTPDEVSVACEERLVPTGVRAEIGFRVLQLIGPIDFSEVGVIAGIAGPLAAAGISLTPIGTFDTDYILVRAADLARAIEILRAAGFAVRE
jgi:hypothetical protein